VAQRHDVRRDDLDRVTLRSKVLGEDRRPRGDPTGDVGPRISTWRAAAGARPSRESRPPRAPNFRRGGLPLAPASIKFDKPLCAALDGFTLHAATRAGALDLEGREALLKYILRRERVAEPTGAGQRPQRKLLMSQRAARHRHGRRAMEAHADAPVVSDAPPALVQATLRGTAMTPSRRIDGRNVRPCETLGFDLLCEGSDNVETTGLRRQQERPLEGVIG
jgi:hypothetical protein